MPVSLAALLEDAFGLLTEGVRNPASPFRTPALASSGAGGPAVRSVVLRGFDRVTRELEVHTDIRSGKLEDFRSMPVAALHVWDPARRVQLRLRGPVTLHVGDEVAAAAWSRLAAASRATYCLAPGPGTQIGSPRDTHETSEEAGFSVFCAMRVAIEEVEWLHLEHGSHARARWRWDNGVFTPMWLVP